MGSDNVSSTYSKAKKDKAPTSINRFPESSTWRFVEYPLFSPIQFLCSMNLFFVASMWKMLVSSSCSKAQKIKHPHQSIDCPNCQPEDLPSILLFSPIQFLCSMNLFFLASMWKMPVSSSCSKAKKIKHPHQSIDSPNRQPEDLPSTLYSLLFNFRAACAKFDEGYGNSCLQRKKLLKINIYLLRLLCRK